MPSPRHNLFSVILWSCLAMFAGVSLSAGAFSVAEAFSQNPSFLADIFAGLLLKEAAKEEVPVEAPKLTTITEGTSRVAIPAQGKTIRIDLENGSVALYENGQFLKNFSAAAVPDEFSPWRVPQGAYVVTALEAEHYSPLAEASFPHAVLFSDNGLIYGTEDAGVTTQRATVGATSPISLNGNKTAGIVLAAENASELFNFADTATEVIVLNEIPENRAMDYNEALREEGAAPSRASPRISARAAFAADLDTGEVFFEKLPDLALPIASISKLFTAIVAKEMSSPEKIIRVSPRALATYGGSGELRSGDEFSAQELFYPLLIESSNDAAEAFAEAVGREQFIAAMNMLAKKLGLVRTSFKDPSGLSFGNTSTARDLFRFAQSLAKEHADILAISKTAAFEAPASDIRAWARRWRSNNEFVRDGNPYLIGTKNGYTDEAAQTTVSLFALPLSETKTRRVAVILLGSNNREGDALALLKESGKDTLYKKNGFPDIFRKKAEKYVQAKEKESPEFRLAIVEMPRIANLPQDASRVFDDILYLKPYDAVFANVEGIIADTGYNIAGDAAIRMPKELLSGLLTLGVDVVNVANAHAGDWGRGAFGDNINLLKENGFFVAGGSKGAADKWKPSVIKRGGVRVGFLGFSDEGPEWLSEDDYLPSLLSAKDPSFEKRVHDAAQGVDHLVASVAFPAGIDEMRVRERARAAIDAGARIVVGFYPSENPRREEYKDGVIFYGQKGLTPAEIMFDKNGVKK